LLYLETPVERCRKEIDAEAGSDFFVEIKSHFDTENAHVAAADETSSCVESCQEFWLRIQGFPSRLGCRDDLGMNPQSPKQA